MKQFKYYISILFLFALNFSFGQKDLDQLLIEYEDATLNKKVELFFYFAEFFEHDEKDSVIFYVNDLQREGIKQKNESAIAMANYGIAPFLLSNSLFEEANEKLRKAEKYYHKVHNDTMLAQVYNYFGNSAFLQGNYTQAELYYDKSADYAEASGEERFKMLSTFNLARIYKDRDEYDKAKVMIQKYIDFMTKDGEMRKLAAAYGLMGQLYLDQNNSKEAILYFTRSMETGLAATSMIAVANGYTNLAIAEYFSGNFTKSEQYFQLALAYRVKEGNKYYIAEGYYNLGDFYYGTGKMDSALINYSQSLKAAKESDNLIGQRDALMELSYVYDTLNQPAEQIRILRLIIDTQEKIAKKQSFKEVNALKLSYQQSEREAINTVGIREDQLHGKVVEYQSIFNNWVWVVLSCVIVLVLFVLYFKRAAKQKT